MRFSTLKCFSVLLIGVLCVLAGKAYCDQPYSPRVNSRGLSALIGEYETQTVSANRSLQLRSIKPVGLKVWVPGFGPVAFKFTKRTVPTWQAHISDELGTYADPLRPLLIEGSARLSRREATPFQGGVRASGSLLPVTAGYSLRLTLRGAHARRPEYDRLLHLRISLSLNGEVLKVRATRRTLRFDNWCGNPEQAASRQLPTGLKAASSFPARVVDISTDADEQFAKKFGSKANAEIAALIKDAETFYIRTFNIRFNIVNQHLFRVSSPYQSKDSLKLIYRFQEYASAQQHLGTADLYHLFTAKEITEGVLGRGFQGVLCSNPTYAYAFSRYSNPSTTIITLAHEIGHNFGASHSKGGIMAASARDSSNKFTTPSFNEITQHLSLYSTCLDRYGPSEPLPADTQIQVQVRRKAGKRIVKATLSDASGAPLSDYTLTIMREGVELKSKTSGSNGRVKFKLKKPGSYQIVADPQGENPVSSEIFELT